MTHALASVALARAGLDRTTRLATPLLVVAGLAPDLDLESMAAGPRTYLACHRAITHSLLGGVALAAILAGSFWWFGRKHPTRPVRFGPALVVAVIGVAAHLLLDLCNSYGIQILWPFHRQWYAWDLLPELDPWILFLLAAGLLLPALFHLISEEIGARPARRAPRGAIAALALVALYTGGRYFLHARAVDLLAARMYHGSAPLVVGAFPSAASPLVWRGVVDTENTVEEVSVPVGPGSYFDPDSSRTRFKPEFSPALAAAGATPAARELLGFARFPLAEVEPVEGGYRVVFRDLRYSEDAGGWRNPFVVVHLDREFHATGEELRFGPVRSDH